jgi:triosephosphate isomerase
MLLDIGVQWTLVGHSERRADRMETNDAVGAKANAAIQKGIKAIVCVGETLEIREAGGTSKHIIDQLRAVVSQVGIAENTWQNIVVAYEPVWAIGTGKVASPEQAQDAHKVRSSVCMYVQSASVCLYVMYV